VLSNERDFLATQFETEWFELPIGISILSRNNDIVYMSNCNAATVNSSAVKNPATVTTTKCKRKNPEKKLRATRDLQAPAPATYEAIWTDADLSVKTNSTAGWTVGRKRNCYPTPSK
jgi:hypothetical protein